MKNKHLVLLFLVTIALGVVVGYWPWQGRSDFRSGILKLDPGDLEQIVIRSNTRPELAFVQTASGWAVTNYARSVMAGRGELDTPLAMLLGMEADSVVKTRRPDTLGLDAGHALRVRFVQRSGGEDLVLIGREVLSAGGPHTYIELPRHKGIYRIRGALRRILEVSLEHFRSSLVCPQTPAAYTAVVHVTTDTLRLASQRDSLGRWVAADTVNDEAVGRWLSLLEELRGLPFADYFDESRAEEKKVMQLDVETDAEPFTLSLFYMPIPELPDDWSRLPDKPVPAPAYIVHSTANPFTFFALHDTLLAQKLVKGWRPEANPVPLSEH